MGTDYRKLEEKARWVRQMIAKTAVGKGFGHMTSGFSIAELAVALYNGILRFDPKLKNIDLNKSDNDRFILSEGQAGIGLYPVLADAGFFPVEELQTFAAKGSRIGVHAEPHTPGIQVLTGSLGHGLPIATGQAFVAQQSDSDWQVVCLTGDGELCEGSNWEAMLSAGNLLLNRLVVIVNRNHQFTIGRTDCRETQTDIALDPLADKFKAFGFETRVIDGHSFPAIFEAFSDFRNRVDPRPLAIIAETLKGKGGFMENKRGWHNTVPTTADDIAKLSHDLGIKLEPAPARKGYDKADENTQQQLVSLRDVYFRNLLDTFKKDPRTVIVSADDGGPSWTGEFEKLPGQFTNVGIAEEQMIGMAAGIALEGYKPWAVAISPFTAFRCQEFVKLDVCAMNLPIVIVGIGCGLSYSIMGPSHHNMGGVASMKIWPNMEIFQPADSVTAGLLADYSYKHDGPLYLLFDRQELPDIYSCDFKPDLNKGLEEVRQGLDAYILANGVTVNAALQVAQKLFEDYGYSVGVIDLFRLKPINFPHLMEIVEPTSNIITYEEDYLICGLGADVATWLAENNAKKDILRIGLPDKFIFDLGGRDVVWELNGLDVKSVTKKILTWLENP